MTTLSIIQVAIKNADDILSQIADIAKKLEYPKTINQHDQEKAEQAGFLVSGYGLNEYRKFAGEGRLYAAIRDDKVVAFSLIYRPEQPADKGDYGTQFIRDKHGAVPVVKQIGVDPDYRGQGLATMLHDDFAEMYRELPVYGALVRAPPNKRSARIHSMLGFSECDIFDGHPDGKLRTIVKRLPALERKRPSSLARQGQPKGI